MYIKDICWLSTLKPEIQTLELISKNSKIRALIVLALNREKLGDETRPVTTIIPIFTILPVGVLHWKRPSKVETGY